MTSLADRLGKRFSGDDLRAVFRTLDMAGTRADVRATVRQLQGRGVSNDAIKDLRELHRRVRRAEGYNVSVGGTRRIRTNSGERIKLKDLPARRVIAPSRRPRPPTIPGVGQNVTIAVAPRDSSGRRLPGSRIAVVHVPPGADTAATLAERAAQAAEGEIMGTDSAMGISAGRQFDVLQVRWDI